MILVKAVLTAIAMFLFLWFSPLTAFLVFENIGVFSGVLSKLLSIEYIVKNWEMVLVMGAMAIAAGYAVYNSLNEGGLNERVSYNYVVLGYLLLYRYGI